MARYSVLIARPRMTLYSNKPVSKLLRVENETGDQLRHDGRCENCLRLRSEPRLARIQESELIPYFSHYFLSFLTFTLTTIDTIPSLNRLRTRL